MSKKFVTHRENYFANLKYDLPAGLVVFMIAIPLCLGIASNATDIEGVMKPNLFAGLLAGIVGGLIVPILSQSQLSISGPAAGLIVIVTSQIEGLGAFDIFLLVVFLSGVIQIIIGLARASFLAYYIPSSVIKGMLAGIGVILILKELPHALGYDKEIFNLEFYDPDKENTFTALWHALHTLEGSSILISIIGISIILLWQNTSLKNINWLPAAMIVVLTGIIINQYIFPQNLQLDGKHLVHMPPINIYNVTDYFTFPRWSAITDSKVWLGALELGMIASVETLLTVEAVDKIDPSKRKSPLDRELIAQGMGNTVCGLLGALPITSVIVRSSAAIDSGGRTKVTAISHGVLLLTAVLFLSSYINLIPRASLAVILLMVGYKLARPSLFKTSWSKGNAQFVPFITTVLAVVFTDLLMGVGIGLAVGLIYVIRTNFHSAVSLTQDGKNYLLRLHRDVSFLNKRLLLENLESIEENSYVIIDGSRAIFMDNDILEIIEEFEQEAKTKNIEIEFKNIHSKPKIKRKFETLTN